MSAFAGFQAEHPLVLKIKQRCSWEPRFLLWGSVYGGLALGLAGYLYGQVPALLWLYGAAVGALGIDAIAVWNRQQKTVANEMLTLAAVCLAASLAFMATTGTEKASLMGLWH